MPSNNKLEHYKGKDMHPLEFLNILADMDTCDGECDMESPYTRCPECQARSLLNEIGEIASTSVRHMIANNPELVEMAGSNNGMNSDRKERREKSSLT